eukprot:5154768-Pyramimonas_sp.AAC.1
MYRSRTEPPPQPPEERPPSKKPLTPRTFEAFIVDNVTGVAHTAPKPAPPTSRQWAGRQWHETKINLR